MIPASDFDLDHRHVLHVGVPLGHRHLTGHEWMLAAHRSAVTKVVTGLRHFRLVSGQKWLRRLTIEC